MRGRRAPSPAGPSWSVPPPSAPGGRRRPPGGPAARPAAAQTTQKREFVIAQGGDISKLDPHFSTSSNDIRVTFNVFDNLTNRHPDGKLQPGLATEWKATAPTTWTFKLRPGVKFHNGDPLHLRGRQVLDRADVRPQREDAGGERLHDVSRIETPDPSTVVFHTKASDPLLPARLAFYGGQIVPKKHLEQVGNDTFNAKPVGTGPVAFVSWAKDDKLVLEANPDYWGGRIDVDRVVFRPVPETAPRVAGLLKGELDLVTQLTPDHWDRINQGATTKGASALYAGLYVLGTNSKVPPLNNWTLKKAHAARRGPRGDRQGALARPRHHPDRPDRQGRRPLRREPAPAGLRPGQGEGASQAVGLQGRAHLSRDDGRPPRQRQGHVRGHRRDVEGRRDQRRRRGGRVLGARPEEPERTFKGLWWSDPTSTLRDPDGMMWRLMAPGGPHDYWRHPEFDELGTSARNSMDEVFRAKAYKRMTELFLEFNPWILVIQPNEDYGLQKYVEFAPNPNQALELRKFNFRMRRA